MVGISIVLDLLRTNPAVARGQSFHSSALFSATLAASAAVTSISTATTFPSFDFGAKSISHCDAGPSIITEDYIENYISTIRRDYGNILQNESLNYNTKDYYIELKPLFSAFRLKYLALTSLRALILFYLPLLEPRLNIEEDDDDDDNDFLQDIAVEDSINLVIPFKKSLRQIILETSVVTTRRILERIVVCSFSQRTAWKLLKDVPKSAVRKAKRGIPTSVYFFSVCRTTFRGHFLGVAASWLVQVGIDFYRFFSSCTNSIEGELDEFYKLEQARFLGRKVFVVTVRCGASLVFASIGAAICSTCTHPAAGQWIGCAIGDLAGPIIVSFCLQ